jgi:hypothetical protein
MSKTSSMLLVLLVTLVAYERLDGTANFEVDPKDPLNGNQQAIYFNPAAAVTTR